MLNIVLPPLTRDATIVASRYFKYNGFLSLGGGKVYHPNQPPNNDVPYSWSPDIPYFPLIIQECPPPSAPGPPGNITKIGCGGCPQDLPDEEFFDWQLANHTVHSLRYAHNKGVPFFIAAGFRRPSVSFPFRLELFDVVDNVFVFHWSHM